jgi:hypothetical protein
MTMAETTQPEGTIAYSFDGQRIVVEPTHESYGAALRIANEIVRGGKWQYFGARGRR